MLKDKRSKTELLRRTRLLLNIVLLSMYMQIKRNQRNESSMILKGKIEGTWEF